MLNLLPKTEKKQLQAARANLILLRYTFVLLLAFGFSLSILAGSYFLLTMTKTSAEQLIEANDTKATAFADTQAEISQLSNNLSSARTLLDQQAAYSKALILIGKALPSGAVIEELELEAANFNGTPVAVTVHATSSDVATQIRQRFASTAGLTNVNLASVSEDDAIEGYPVSAEMTFTISREAVR